MKAELLVDARARLGERVLWCDTRSLAKDLGKRNIRVNTLVPGWVMTERQLRNWVTPEAEKEIDANQCLPGRLQSEHIAAMALFLAADDSRMCTAQSFVVDGGWS